MQEAHFPGGMIRSQSSRLSMLNRVLDGLIIWAGMWLSCLLFDVNFGRLYVLAMLVAVASFLFLAQTGSIYGSWRMVPLKEIAARVFQAWFVVAILLVALAFFAKASGSYSRFVVVSWFTMTPALLILQRIVVQSLLREMRSRGWNLRTLAIVGSGKNAQKLATWVNESEWMGLKLVGIYDDRKEPRGGRAEILGRIEDLVREAGEGRIDYVYSALPMKAENRIIRIVDALSDTAASVYIMPDSFIFDLMNARWINVGGIPMVSIFESPFYGVDGWLKRLEDIVLGSLILILIAIPMALIALGVKLSSPGPILFRQRRYGLNGRVVEVWKFRSMLVCEDGQDIPQAKKRDPRVTRFGAFLRRTSLDELPQFINVLQGHMSLVGPRPHAVSHNEQYRRLIHGYMLRHKVKPGITGWAQINGWRGETDTVEKMKARVEHDLYYIQNWSLWLDIRIIFLTVFRGFVGKQAY